MSELSPNHHLLTHNDRLLSIVKMCNIKGRRKEGHFTVTMTMCYFPLVSTSGMFPPLQLRSWMALRQIQEKPSWFNVFFSEWVRDVSERWDFFFNLAHITSPGLGQSILPTANRARPSVDERRKSPLRAPSVAKSPCSNSWSLYFIKLYPGNPNAYIPQHALSWEKQTMTQTDHRLLMRKPFLWLLNQCQPVGFSHERPGFICRL